MYRPSLIVYLLLLSLALACESASEGGTPDVYAPAEVAEAPDVQPDTAEAPDVVVDVEDSGPGGPDAASDVGDDVAAPVCPTAVISCDEGTQVTPQTNLHLRGDQSSAMMGEIRKWEWQVHQPVGSQSVYVPSATFPSPTFEVNVAGTYTFYLRVWDEENTPSCAPAEYEVVVIPDEAIHVELTWTTPGDPDETDTGPYAGSNVDLHFLHPDAPDERYFTDPYDCYWENPHPDWGTPENTNDDPRLDRDDTDGAGPENINLAQPENDARYEVAVHYTNDHGFGVSFVTVRVYIYSNLEWEIANIRLIPGDLWSVCTIDWPSGVVTQVSDPDGGYLITHDYPFSEDP